MVELNGRELHLPCETDRSINITLHRLSSITLKHITPFSHINLCLVLLAFCFATPSTAHADIIRFDFSGEIDSVLAGNYIIGEPRAGTLIYDSDTQLTTFYGSPFSGSFNGAIQTITLGPDAVDTVTFNIASQTLWAIDDLELAFEVQGYDFATGRYESLNFSIRGPTTFANALILATEPNVANRAAASFYYSRFPPGGGSAEASYWGLADSVSVSIVPEPSSVLLLLYGGLFVNQRRSKGR